MKLEKKLRTTKLKWVKKNKIARRRNLMNQPRWVEYMLPELKILNDNGVQKRSVIIEMASNSLKLTSEQKAGKIKSGMFVYVNRGGWALTYLKQSGLIESPKRSTFVITEKGKQFLNVHPNKIDESDLNELSGYREFKERTRKQNQSELVNGIDEAESAMSPLELIHKGEDEIKESVCNELLEKVRRLTPKAFEKLVVDLLVAMGYGDKNDPDCGFTVGQTGDGGIDGVIKEDKLGLKNIYIQAKRYGEGNTVSAHEVRDFGGALLGADGGNSKSGVFITSSDFSKESRDYVKKLEKGTRIILINGKELADYMYQYGMGVSQSEVIIINKIDYDYFGED